MTTGFWVALAEIVGITAIVAGIAYAVRRANARKSTKDWFVGWVVFGLSVSGFFAAGIADLLLFTANRYWIGMAMFGFSVGLASGHLIARFLWRYYRKEIEGEEGNE